VSDDQIALWLEDYGLRSKRAVDTTRKARGRYGFNVPTSGHSLSATTSSYTEKLGNEDWYEEGVGFSQGSLMLSRAA
jgi:hypothetical protein